MNGKTRDERLRRLLREADPADGETGLTTEEVRAMRRTVLTAIPDRIRRFVPSPVLAGAVVAALAAILLLWLGGDHAPVSPREPARVATTAPPPRPAPVPKAAAEPAPSTDVAVAERTSSGTAREKRSREKRRPAPEMLAKMEEQPRARQIQFSTPGGTRVIWILTSDKAL